MIKQYRTGVSGKNLIEEVDVERETETSVWVKGSRLQKMTCYHQYFDTWGEAHAYLTEEASRDVVHARMALERAENKLSHIKGLQP